jgi:hypothetical protein
MSKKALIPVLIGLGVIGFLWYKNKKRRESMPKSVEEAVSVATEKEKQNYTPAFLSQYDIVMPPNQASKAVKKAAFEMQDARTQKELVAMANKKPVYL